MDAVQVSLKYLRVHIAQVHWLCSISRDTLRLTCRGEKIGSLGEDIGVDHEAFHVSRQLANTDVEGGAEIMSMRR